MKARQYIPFILTLLLISFAFYHADAQCAMCKSTAEQSPYAKNLNMGIEYLLLAPVVILGSVLLIWLKNKDKFITKH